jgi:hypothetical protein
VPAPPRATRAERVGEERLEARRARTSQDTQRRTLSGRGSQEFRAALGLRAAPAEISPSPGLLRVRRSRASCCHHRSSCCHVSDGRNDESPAVAGLPCPACPAPRWELLDEWPARVIGCAHVESRGVIETILPSMRNRLWLPVIVCCCHERCHARPRTSHFIRAWRMVWFAVFSIACEGGAYSAAQHSAA